MPQIVVSTTFRDFDGSDNDRMQLQFLNSLKRQTFQDYILIVTVFRERKVETVVKKMLGDKAVFAYDCDDAKYKFSLSKTFMNGVDYGLKNHARIIVDCSSDIVLQKSFLEIVSKRTGSFTSGISHPNIFRKRWKDGKIKYSYGKLSEGIDIRFYSLDMFQNRYVYNILNRFPSYDYGAGIETILCGIAIKYAKKRLNIFMESKTLKEENIRERQVGGITEFMREGVRRNVPTVARFMRCEHIPWKYMDLLELNRAYKVSMHMWIYNIWFGKEILYAYFGRFLKEIRVKQT